MKASFSFLKAQSVLITCLHCKWKPVNGSGCLTFYKLFSASFQTVFRKNNIQVSYSYWNKLRVRYRLISHVLPFLSISSPLTVHLTSFYFHLFSLSLMFRLLVMLSPSPHGKVNVYLSPKGAVYSSVAPSSSLCIKLQCEPSQLALDIDVEVRRRIASNKRFGHGEKYTN